jgi:hypothetical protein
VAKEFLAQVEERARGAGLVSDEHFTVDGTLLEAWVSMKGFQPKGENKSASPDDPGNPTASFHGEKRSIQTHESKTDQDEKMARRGACKDAKLSYSGNLLVENGNGLIVNAELLEANGRAERDAAPVMLEQEPGDGRITDHRCSLITPRRTTIPAPDSSGSGVTRTRSTLRRPIFVPCSIASSLFSR